MTNRIALVLFLLILGAVGIDLAMGWGGTMFLLRKGFDFLNWVMFWR